MPATSHMQSRYFLLASLLLLLGVCANVQADTMTQQQLLSRLDAGSAPLVLDVRTPKEYAESHVPGAVNIRHDELAARLAEVSAGHDDEVVVYCESGRRAGMAEGVLKQAGFGRVLHLEGDMAGWRKAGLPRE